MAEKIEHEGVVIGADEVGVRVLISQASGCGSCAAKGRCMSAESKEKVIDCQADEPLAVGDKVIVEVEQKVGWLAVLLAFILPFLLVISLIYILGQFMEEQWSGTIALVSLLPYYALLSLFRKRMSTTFRFRARKI